MSKNPNTPWRLPQRTSGAKDVRLSEEQKRQNAARKKIEDLALEAELLHDPLYHD